MDPRAHVAGAQLLRTRPRAGCGKRRCVGGHSIRRRDRCRNLFRRRSRGALRRCRNGFDRGAILRARPCVSPLGHGLPSNTFTPRAAQGIAECRRRLELDRNLAMAHGFIGLAKYFAVGARKPRLTSRRRCVSLRAIPTPISGWRSQGSRVWTWRRRRSGYHCLAAPPNSTVILRSRISGLPQPAARL